MAAAAGVVVTVAVARGRDCRGSFCDGGNTCCRTQMPS